MTIKNYTLLFKTHLDIGFTDTSENVVTKYMNLVIPNAIRIVQELRENGGEACLARTTGSWLIYEFLRTKSGKESEEMCQAINGDVRWHVLPFTTHAQK